MRLLLTRLYYDFLVSRTWKHGKNTDVVHESTLVKARDGYSIPVNIFRPTKKQSEKLPVIIYYHGGGFVIGSLKGYHNLLSSLCNLTQSIIVSMDYRLAPQYPYPTPLQDALDVSKWAFKNTEHLNAAKQFVLAGDSAGGNLAAVIAQHLKQDQQLKGQLLICPVTDYYIPKKKSFIDNAKVGPLTASMMKWFTDNYTKNGFESEDQNIFPIKSTDFSNLPPALVFTAEKDVLRDDGNEYAEKLKEAGVDTVHIQQANEVHNFPLANHKTDTTEAFNTIRDWLKERFST